MTIWTYFTNKNINPASTTKTKNIIIKIFNHFIKLSSFKLLSQYLADTRRIELLTSARQADVLPLNYASIIVGIGRIELPSLGWKPTALTIMLYSQNRAHIPNRTEIYYLQDSCSNHWAIQALWQRDRDSNPDSFYTLNSFQDCFLTIRTSLYGGRYRIRTYVNFHLYGLANRWLTTCLTFLLLWWRRRVWTRVLMKSRYRVL